MRVRLMTALKHFGETCAWAQPAPEPASIAWLPREERELL